MSQIGQEPSQDSGVRFFLEAVIRSRARDEAE
jgi:hypothetical protein